MKMYSWISLAMANYSAGRVIVAAPDVDTARSMVMSLAKQAFETHLWYGSDLSSFDEDDWESLKSFKEKLELDIRNEPDVRPVFFITGSE